MTGGFQQLSLPLADSQPTAGGPPARLRGRLPIVSGYPGNVSADSSIALAIQWFNWWMQTPPQHYAPNTRTNYARVAARFARQVGQERPLKDITDDDVRRFLNSGEKLSSKSVELETTALRAFFGALEQAGALPNNPARRVFAGPAHSPLPEVLFDYQVERLRTVAAELVGDTAHPQPRPAVLLALMLDLGLRLMEVEQLTFNDVDLSDLARVVVHVHPVERRHAAKTRTLVAPPEFGPAIRLYIQQYGLDSGKLFPFDRKTIKNDIAMLGAQAGIKPRLSPERLRWTFALKQFLVTAGHGDETAMRARLGLSELGWQDARQKLEQLARNMAPLQ